MPFLVDGVIYEDGDAAVRHAVRNAYERGIRPLCCCTSPCVPMYISKLGDEFLVKRMPNSGARHALTCDSFEPPEEVSGRQAIVSAIRFNALAGLTTLALGFSMKRAGARTRSDGESVPVSASRPTTSRLSLRALLHFLLDEAGLARWVPAMNGKRNWAVVQKYLSLAAEGKIIKGRLLSEQLLIPEPFSVETKDLIRTRRARLLESIQSGEDSRRLMLLVGEVKAMTDSKIGKKLLVRHLPDFPFMLDNALSRQLMNRFEGEMTLWGALDESHLLIAGTFSVGTTGVAKLETATLVVTDKRWLVVEDKYESVLVEKLVRENRWFVRLLRYGQSPLAPIGVALLTDMQRPVVLHIMSNQDDSSSSGDRLPPSGDKYFARWEWNRSAAMPALPTTG